MREQSLMALGHSAEQGGAEGGTRPQSKERGAQRSIVPAGARCPEECSARRRGPWAPPLWLPLREGGGHSHLTPSGLSSGLIYTLCSWLKRIHVPLYFPFHVSYLREETNRPHWFGITAWNNDLQNKQKQKNPPTTKKQTLIYVGWQVDFKIS